jgi:hypothetical protein
MEAFLSEAETLSRGEARLRRRAAYGVERRPPSTGYERALDRLSASEVLASMRKDGAVCCGERQGRFWPGKSGAFRCIVK